MNEVYYYWVEFIIDHKNYFLIWVMDDKNYFITNNNRFVFFENFSNAQRFAENMGLDISDEKIDVFNIDEYVPKDKDSVDCNATLDLWNILSDVAATVSVPFEGDDVSYNILHTKNSCMGVICLRFQTVIIMIRLGMRRKSRT